jgi:hypothetical protein
MESKKINQLATELSPDLSDLTIIGDPTTGISKKITLSQMASLFTGTVEEYANFAAFPLVGVADTIYIALDTNILYRWNTGTSAYVELSPNIVSSLVFNDANGFDGTINLVGSVATLTITTALTTGSVGFIGASGALLQDNANFFWDDTNNRLGLGTNAPTTALDIFGSGIIGRINGTSTNNAYLGFASAGTNKWSVGNVQSDHRFRIFSEANSAELISVLQTGEFGIGIANPTTKFHIDGGATALIANLDANVSVAKTLSFRSDNSNRINLEVSGTESGSNAGANFFIRRYSDAGALIDTPFTITRSTGAITLATVLNGTSAIFSSTVNATNGLLIGNGGATASSNYIPKFTSASAIANSAIFDNSGNIGINNTNSVNKLDIVQTGSNNAVTGVGLKIASDAGSAASMAFSQSARGTGIIGMQAAATAPSNFVIGTDVTGNIVFKNGISGTDLSTGTDRLTINSAGSVGVGVSPIDSTISFDIQNNSATSNNVFLRIKNNVGSEDTGIKIAGIYGTAYEHTFGVNTLLNSGDLIFHNSNSLGYRWYVNGDQRMLLTSAGDLTVNGGGSPAKFNLGYNFYILNDQSPEIVSFVAGSGSSIFRWMQNTTSEVMRLQSGGVLKINNIGSGTVTATSGVLSAVSDKNLKIEDGFIDNALEKVLNLKPRYFLWKEESGLPTDLRQLGFYAQEVNEALGEEAANTPVNENDKWGIYDRAIIAMLTKAIQELKAEIDVLKIK